MHDVAVDAAISYGQFQDLEAFEEALYDDVVYLVRYLRQPIAWVEQLSTDEYRKWARALSKLLAAEHGVKPSESKTALADVVTAPSGGLGPGKLATFGDWDGGG